MATPPVLRVVEREMVVFARLWRSAVFSTFLSPVLFLAAMGLGLGGLVLSGCTRVFAHVNGLGTTEQHHSAWWSRNIKWKCWLEILAALCSTIP